MEVEALGAVFLQAAAVGRPVIVGASGGAPEAVVEGQTGLIVDGGSHESVAAALLQLIEDRPRAAAMGAAGALRIQRDFSWDQIAGRFRCLLEAAIT
jgi:phosphatidylinositol alpha-1,6-mannosyltransferase